MTLAQYLSKPDVDVNTSIIIVTSHGRVRHTYFPKTKTFETIHIVDFDEPVDNNPVFDVKSYSDLEEALTNLITSENSKHEILIQN